MGMRVDQFLQPSSNVFAENRLLKLAFGALIVITLYNGYTVSNLKDTVRTEILPPYSEKRWTISGSDANDEYLADMARYVAQSLGTWNPASVRIQLNELLKLFHPEAYPKYRDRFTRIADQAERYASVSFALQWDPGQPIVRKENTLSIHAVRRRITGDAISRTEPIEFLIHFVIESGRFWIMDIDEISAAGKNDG